MTEKMSDVKQLNYNALMVLQCLFENTDSIKHLSLKEIEATIRGKYGYGPSHNTINKILQYLPDYGFDVRKGTRANPGFYLNTRYFSDGEIIYLIELFKNSKSFRGKEKERFLQKLHQYLGPSFQEMDDAELTERKNKDLAKKIETINTAIKTGKQLWFDVPGIERLHQKNRVQSNPYKVFERNGEICLLYGTEEEGEYRLKQMKIRGISNLFIDPNYVIVPMFKAKNADLIDDVSLSRLSPGEPDRHINDRLLIKLTPQEDRNKREYLNGRFEQNIIRDYFGDKNIQFFEKEEQRYAYIRDVYGDGEEWFFHRYYLGMIIWPEKAVRRMLSRIKPLYEMYSKDNVKKEIGAGGITINKETGKHPDEEIQKRMEEMDKRWEK